MGQYLKGNNMATYKFIMANFMRMGKVLTLTTPVLVKVQQCEIVHAQVFNLLFCTLIISYLSLSCPRF